ncbi:caspase-8-like [Corticium candelabrum]|uniref:caspase-8-like n=1 Tax=Corticium candelabrum TaxID=121492 RepID=UPI002E2676F9|nr:caspase-8-like [Corticium candelabrum]
MSKQLDDKVKKSLKFRKKLKRISDDLTSREVYQLKCLAAEHIPAGERERITNGMKLFESLEKRRLLQDGNEDYLIGLLQQIGRRDIISKQELTVSGRESLKKEKVENTYNSLLHVVGEQLVSAELDALKGLVVDVVPRGRLQHVISSMSLFAELEGCGLLSESDLNFLKDLLETVGRIDLVKVLDNFKEKREVIRPSGRGGQVDTHLHVPQTHVTTCQEYLGEERSRIVTHPEDECDEHFVVINSQTHDTRIFDESTKRKQSPCSHASIVHEPTSTDFPESMESSVDDPPSTRRDHGVGMTSGEYYIANQLREKAEQHFPVETELGQTGGSVSYLVAQRAGENRYQSSNMHELPPQVEAARRLEEQRLREAEAEKNRARIEFMQVQEELEQTQQLIAEQQRAQITLQQHWDRERTKREDLETERRVLQEEVRLLKAREEQLLQQAQRPTEPLPDLQCYPMTRNPRGYALIISIERFPNSTANLADRQGSERDVQMLSHTFERLKFRIDVRRDLTGSDLVAALREYGSRDHSDYDCFVCCMLSHGKKDFIYGSDSDPVNVEQLTGQVNGLSCPSLRAKPKLFFIQACRGTDDDTGVETDAVFDAHTQRDAIEQVKIPLSADYLLGYAAPPGKVSFRSTTQGSWYISALCETLNTYAGRGVSLTDMLIMVNQRLANATTSDGFKQIPSPINQLTKRLVFTPIG